MSKFEVKVVRIDDVVDHPDADRLSLNKIGGFVAVSNKTESGEHRYRPGQLVVYVPEGAVVPLEVLEQYGYTDDEGKGILAGSKGNRVKAIKLRGVLSQGLIFPLVHNVEDDCVRRGSSYQEVVEGSDVAEFLDITKYEPEIPASMSGDVVYYPFLTLKFDIENQQKYPDAFVGSDEIIATEKLHGTFAGFVFLNQKMAEDNGIDTNDLMDLGSGVLYATAFSKGLGEKGLVFKVTEENLQRNIYLRALTKLMENRLAFDIIKSSLEYTNEKITLLGEVYGKGVQDLTYSLDSPAFAAFNIVSGEQFMRASEFYDPDGIIVPNIPTVPVVYRGPFGPLVDDLKFYRDSKSMVDGMTIREGIVVTPLYAEGRDERFGRLAVKMISPNYLTRKGGTEYN